MKVTVEGKLYLKIIKLYIVSTMLVVCFPLYYSYLYSELSYLYMVRKETLEGVSKVLSLFISKIQILFNFKSQIVVL